MSARTQSAAMHNHGQKAGFSAKQIVSTSFAGKVVSWICFICGCLLYEWLLFQVTWISRADLAFSFLKKCIRALHSKLSFAPMRSMLPVAASSGNRIRQALIPAAAACMIFGLTYLAAGSGFSFTGLHESSRAAALHITDRTTADSVSGSDAVEAELLNEQEKSASVKPGAESLSGTAIPETGGVPQAAAVIDDMLSDSRYEDGLPVTRRGRAAADAGSSSPSDIEFPDTEPPLVTDEQSRAFKRIMNSISVRTEPRIDWGGSFIWPADGPVTSWYGYRNATVGSTNHKGIDISGSTGNTIYAAECGEVIFSGNDGRFGKVIRIKHESGVVSLYAHCNSLHVETGDWVEQGQVIGGMGMTGTASGVHLHFEVIIDGVNVNPSRCLP